MHQTNPRHSLHEILVKGAQGAWISLWHLPSKDSKFSPVVLTHGTFSNGTICLRLAEFLQDKGFDCWIYEWAGHGKSGYGDLTPDAEGHALHDVPLVLKAVLAATRAKDVLWVAHSGGGFLPLMYLARNLDQAHTVKGLVMIGSQSFFAAPRMGKKILILLFWLSIKLWGKTPGPLFRLGPEDETQGFLSQWCAWNFRGKWQGRENFDYAAAMAHITMPALGIAGTADQIAPPDGVQKLLNLLGSAKKEFRVFGKKAGFAEDYTHARLIACKNARNDIWPVILNWLVHTD